MNSYIVANIGSAWALTVFDPSGTPIVTYTVADYADEAAAAAAAVESGYLLEWQVSGSPTVEEYTDGWSIELWNARYREVLALNVAGTRDFLNIRDRILALIVESAGVEYSAWTLDTAFGTLNADQQLVACIWLSDIMPIELFKSIVPLQQLKPMVKYFFEQAQLAWAIRMEVAEALIFTTMPPASRHQLLKDTDLLSSIYLRGGILTNAADGTDGIGDYLASTSGYSGAGFVEAGYAVNAGQTRSGIATAALAILNGNY